MGIIVSTRFDWNANIHTRYIYRVCCLGDWILAEEHFSWGYRCCSCSWFGQIRVYLGRLSLRTWSHQRTLSQAITRRLLCARPFSISLRRDRDVIFIVPERVDEAGWWIWRWIKEGVAIYLATSISAGSGEGRRRASKDV